jgi:hypothetical protein
VQTDELVLKVDRLCTFSVTPGVLCSVQACTKAMFLFCVDSLQESGY